MPRKKYKPEEIVAKLRQVDVWSLRARTSRTASAGYASAEANLELTLHLDHLMGADQSPLITSSTETFAGVPQIIHQLPLDGSVSPALKDLDLTTIFDRLIIGPSPYPWAMGVAFTMRLRRRA
jgi:hypothetical protein